MVRSLSLCQAVFSGVVIVRVCSPEGGGHTGGHRGHTLLKGKSFRQAAILSHQSAAGSSVGLIMNLQSFRPALGTTLSRQGNGSVDSY